MWRYTERACNMEETLNRDVALSSLYTTYIISVELCMKSKFSLRVTLNFSESSDIVTYYLRAFHAAIIG